MNLQLRKLIGCGATDCASRCGVARCGWPQFTHLCDQWQLSWLYRAMVILVFCGSNLMSMWPYFVKLKMFLFSDVLATWTRINGMPILAPLTFLYILKIASTSNPMSISFCLISSVVNISSRSLNIWYSWLSPWCSSVIEEWISRHVW